MGYSESSVQDLRDANFSQQCGWSKFRQNDSESHFYDAADGEKYVASGVAPVALDVWGLNATENDELKGEKNGKVTFSANSIPALSAQHPYKPVVDSFALRNGVCLSDGESGAEGVSMSKQASLSYLFSKLSTGGQVSPFQEQKTSVSSTFTSSSFLSNKSPSISSNTSAFSGSGKMSPLHVPCSGAKSNGPVQEPTRLVLDDKRSKNLLITSLSDEPVSERNVGKFLSEFGELEFCEKTPFSSKMVIASFKSELSARDAVVSLNGMQGVFEANLIDKGAFEELSGFIRNHTQRKVTGPIGRELTQRISTRNAECSDSDGYESEPLSPASQLLKRNNVGLDLSISPFLSNFWGNGSAYSKESGSDTPTRLQSSSSNTPISLLAAGVSKKHDSVIAQTCSQKYFSQSANSASAVPSPAPSANVSAVSSGFSVPYAAAPMYCSSPSMTYSNPIAPINGATNGTNGANGANAQSTPIGARAPSGVVTPESLKSFTPIPNGFMPLSLGKQRQSKKPVQGRLREIRRRLEGFTSAVEIDILFKECLPFAVELSIDYVGNVVMQKFVERCNDEQRLQLIQQLAPDFASIGIHKNGTWVAQRVIDYARTTEQMSAIVMALAPYTVSLMSDSFGNYVLQCCLRLGAQFNQFIFNAMSGETLTLCTARFGARGSRTCLESLFATPEQKRQVAVALMEHGPVLAQDPNGVIMLNWLLDASGLLGRYRVLAPILVPHLETLCKNKLGSSIVLKIVNQQLEPDARATLLQVMFDPRSNLIAKILADQYQGVVTVQKIFSCPSLTAAEQTFVNEAIKSFASTSNYQQQHVIN